nr:LacI family transcriptional regulator [Alloscardovia omnicolens]
ERYAGDDTGVIGQTLLEKVSNDFQGYVSVTDTVEGVPYRFDAVKLEYIERETTIPLDDLGVE